MKKRSKILLLFSGGLDSIIAAKILEKAGAKVKGITFSSVFFDAEKALRNAKKINLKIISKDISQKHLKIVKKPKYGWGKNLNPCIDCHALMLKEAQKTAQKNSFDGLATGEVLGQRPFSQNLQALKIIEKQTGLENEILRPLSAKVLEKTVLEKKGSIEREKLLNIVGRSRKIQLQLARKFKITDYPTPSGGCILTDPEFSKKAKKLLKINPKAQIKDFTLIKQGRLFSKNKSLIIVGRNQQENKTIENQAIKDDILLELKIIPGPLALIRTFQKTPTDEKRKIIEYCKQKILTYSPKAKGKNRFEFQQENM
ncbi:MAG: DUF814 domain-containing protein [Candidatus Moranbacteria bacterium]|nr:DUF814 domain-containing protein [Candidatus Moranbacteria bacterium]